MFCFNEKRGQMSWKKYQILEQFGFYEIDVDVLEQLSSHSEQLSKGDILKSSVTPTNGFHNEFSTSFMSPWQYG